MSFRLGFCIVLLHCSRWSPWMPEAPALRHCASGRFNGFGRFGRFVVCRSGRVGRLSLWSLCRFVALSLCRLGRGPPFFLALRGIYCFSWRETPYGEGLGCAHSPETSPRVAPAAWWWQPGRNVSIYSPCRFGRSVALAALSLSRLVALSLCRFVALVALVALSLCRFVALSLCRLIALSLCRSVALSLWSLCRSVALSLCRFVAWSLCRFVALSLCRFGRLGFLSLRAGERQGYQRQSDRATKRQSDKATERQSDKATNATERQSDKATKRQSDRATERQSDRATERQSDQSDRATERQSDTATKAAMRQSDRATERQSDKATERPKRQRDKATKATKRPKRPKRPGRPKRQGDRATKATKCQSDKATKRQSGECDTVTKRHHDKADSATKRLKRPGDQRGQWHGGRQGRPEPFPRGSGRPVLAQPAPTPHVRVWNSAQTLTATCCNLLPPRPLECFVCVVLRNVVAYPRWPCRCRAGRARGSTQFARPWLGTPARFAASRRNANDRRARPLSREPCLDRCPADACHLYRGAAAGAQLVAIVAGRVDVSPVCRDGDADVLRCRRQCEHMVRVRQAVAECQGQGRPRGRFVQGLSLTGIIRRAKICKGESLVPR